MGKVTTHQRKARDLMQREDWDGALTELQRVLGLDANNPTLHNQIGDVYLRKGAVDQACDHFEMAVDLYSNLSLHNNAVALCRKVVRLAPTRVEVRYHLARLRMDQGLRSDATAAFIDYLEHAQPDDEEAADALEQRCVEVVESFPDLAPVGQIVEKLETVKRPQGAYKIVQRAAQRATDAGDTAAATRFTEKMRSLRVLLDGQGSAQVEAAGSVDPSTVEFRADNPEVAVSDRGADGAAVQPAPRTKSNVDPTAIDLPSAEAAGSEAPVRAPSNALLAEVELPGSGDAVAGAVNHSGSAKSPTVTDAALVPEIDLDNVGSLNDTVAELQDVLDLDAPGAPTADPAVVSASEDDSMMPEYELPETSLEEVASLLKQEGLQPTVGAPGSPGTVARSEDDLLGSAGLLIPEDVDAAATHPAAPDVSTALSGAPLLQPEDAAAERDWDATQAAATRATDPPAAQNVASIAETFAEPPTVESRDAAESGMIPLMDPDDRPASVVYEPAPSSRRPGATDEMRRAPVWIPSPNAVSPDPDPSEEGQTQELEEVIDTFREQMARALGDDGAARYDLGVAYYEMGLYNEALAEFEVAVRCPGLSTRTLEMMSSCLAQQGRYDEVVSLLEGPLAEIGDSSAEDRLSLQYAMGLALEAVGQQDDARRHFEEVALVDIGFKDVQSRLQR